MAAIASASAVRPCVQGLSCRRPATARAAPKAVRCTAQLEQQKQRQQVAISLSLCIDQSQYMYGMEGLKSMRLLTARMDAAHCYTSQRT